jgi:hypothetical protein
MKKKIIHLIAHSHQDAGWGLTPMGYYDGGVKQVYTSVFNYLKENPEKRFTHAEIWFFKNWWYEQNLTTQ